MRKIIIFLISLYIVSCSEKEPYQPVTEEQENVGSVQSGIFIVNEGNFGNGTGSLSYYDPENKKVSNNVFQNVNGRSLGDVGQSMQVYGDKAFIVVNNSRKIEVIDKTSYQSLGTITGFVSPRYIHVLDESKAYVTDLYDTDISIVNPESYAVTATISVNNNNTAFTQHTTEQIIAYGQYLFINCWSYDNTILVVDTQTDLLVDSITVRKQPASMVLDKNNKLWVLTDGGYQGSSYGHEYPAIIKIDADTRTIENTFLFSSLDDTPGDLSLSSNKDTLIYLNGDVYKMSVDAGALPTDVFIDAGNKLFYSLAVNPYNSDIYVSDAVDYSQNGMVYRYNSEGLLVDSFEAGIIPTFFYFMNE